MFIINLTYKKSLDEVDKYLEAHKKFLSDSYKNGYFLMSGRKNPRDGGIIIADVASKSELKKIISEDPFNINDIAEYRIIEFEASMYDKNKISL